MDLVGCHGVCEAVHQVAHVGVSVVGIERGCDVLVAFLELSH